MPPLKPVNVGPLPVDGGEFAEGPGLCETSSQMAARLPALQPLLSFPAMLCGLESFWLVRHRCFLGGQLCKTGKSVFVLKNCSVTFFMCCFFKVMFLRLNILTCPIRHYQICNIIFICKSFLHQIFFCQGRTGSGITESRAETVLKIPDSCC